MDEYVMRKLRDAQRFCSEAMDGLTAMMKHLVRLQDSLDEMMVEIGDFGRPLSKENEIADFIERDTEKRLYPDRMNMNKTIAEIGIPEPDSVPDVDGEAVVITHQPQVAEVKVKKPVKEEELPEPPKPEKKSEKKKKGLLQRLKGKKGKEKKQEPKEDTKKDKTAEMIADMEKVLAELKKDS